MSHDPHDLAARLEALERRVASVLPHDLTRRPNVQEPPEWIRAMVTAKVDERREDASSRMSWPIVAEVTIAGDIDQDMADRVCDQLDSAHLAREIHATLDSQGGLYGPRWRSFGRCAGMRRL